MTDTAGIGSQTVTQVGIVVRDIEAAIDRYCRVFDVDRPPVIITDGPEQARTVYNGQPTPARAKLAFFHMGQVDIELIEPIGGPSTWQAFLDEKGEGVHHIAFWVADTDGAARRLAEQGAGVEQQGHFTGGMYTYISSAPILGVALELLEKKDN